MKAASEKQEDQAFADCVAVAAFLYSVLATRGCHYGGWQQHLTSKGRQLPPSCVALVSPLQAFLLPLVSPVTSECTALACCLLKVSVESEKSSISYV